MNRVKKVFPGGVKKSIADVKKNIHSVKMGMGFCASSDGAEVVVCVWYTFRWGGGRWRNPAEDRRWSL